MDVVSEEYYCYSRCWHGELLALGRSILAVLFWHQGLSWTRCWLTADRCRRPAGTTKATETLKHPLLQDPRGTRTR